MQKKLQRRLYVAKKIALCIFLVFTAISIIPRSTYGTTSFVLDDIQKKVTISMKNATLESILIEINQQTGIDYGFQSNGAVDKNRKFTLEVRDVTVGL